MDGELLMTPEALIRRCRKAELGHGEQGIALISALLIMMICTVVVTASLALAVHSNNQSAAQRNVTAALHAANYGLQEELASLAGQPASGGATCSPIAGGILPNTSLPTQWFSVSMPNCTAVNLTRTIIANGFALGDGASPGSTPPSTAVERTVVAHVTLQPAGALSNGGYGFPDGILSFGTLSGSGLAVTGGPVSIRSDGAVTLSNGSLNLSSGSNNSSLSSWGNITLTNNSVTGNVASASTVTLSNSNVSGYVEGSTVNLGSPASSVGSSRSGTVKLPTQPPVPTFTYNASDWLSLTGAASATTTCPAVSGATLSGLYVLSSTCPAFTPSALSGTVAVVVNAGANLTVSIPTYLGPTSGQLYLVVAGGTLNLSDAGAATPVFAYASGTLTVAGSAIVGQLVGGNVTASAPTNLIAQLVSTTVGGIPTFAPDFAPPAVGSGPAPTGFVPQINDEYLCAPGVTTAC